MSEEHIGDKGALEGCSGGVYKTEGHDCRREKHPGIYRQLREVKVSELKDIS